MSEPTAPPLDYKTPESAARGWLNVLNWREEVGLLIVYALLVLALSFLSPYFFSVRNFLNILMAVSVIGIVSVASTMVIVSGGIDLSIGSVVGMAGVLVAQLSQHFSVGVAAVAALLGGALIGLFNGVLITRARINPFITTLATLSIFRGLGFDYSGGLTRTIGSPAFNFIGRGFVSGIPCSVVLMGLLFLLAGWVMGWTVFGRSIYAIGGNARASRLAGLPVRRVMLIVYIFSGLGAALGGVTLTSQLGAAAPQAALGLELSVIAAVILGGTSLNGGKGTILGTLLGVLIMGTLNNGLTLIGASSYQSQVAQGVVLLLAAGLDQLRQYLSKSG